MSQLSPVCRGGLCVEVHPVRGWGVFAPGHLLLIAAISEETVECELGCDPAVVRCPPLGSSETRRADDPPPGCTDVRLFVNLSFCTDVLMKVFVFISYGCVALTRVDGRF